jgi:hypothetical protein
MKMIVKKTGIVLSVLAAVALTACSHKNPLQTQPEAEIATFLKQASLYAEQTMNYPPAGAGVMYGACMLHPQQDDPNFCPTLYNHMLDYAKQSEGSFSKITRADLQDKAAFDHIKRTYLNSNLDLRD